MKFISDVVKEQATKTKGWGGTSEGLKLLELRDIPENFMAANMYMGALAIIYKQMEEIKAYEQEKRS